jgi:lysozyme
MKKRHFVILIIAAVAAIVIMVFIYSGKIWPNDLFISRYSIRGIDVSNHQGKIDWTEVAGHKKIIFAYMKATEGSDYRDKYFEANWAAVSQTRLYKGAYHFFSESDSGYAQAMNFIETVPAESGCLPPVVDIEESRLDRETFRKELDDFLSLVEMAYGQKPIIYVSNLTYEKYIKGAYHANPVWIRGVVVPPGLRDGRKWLLWQYSNRGNIDGIGEFTDLNVFQGEMSDFAALLSE